MGISIPSIDDYCTVLKQPPCSACRILFHQSHKESAMYKIHVRAVIE